MLKKVVCLSMFLLAVSAVFAAEASKSAQADVLDTYVIKPSLAEQVLKIVISGKFRNEYDKFQEVPLEKLSPACKEDCKELKEIYGNGEKTASVAYIDLDNNGSNEMLVTYRHYWGNGGTAYDISVSENAEILSDTEYDGKNIPVSYRYENANGERFLVLNISTRSPKDLKDPKDNILKHYARSRQYADMIPWLGKEPLPAYVYGHPALYMQCKKGADGSLAVGLWNFHADIAFAPTVELNGSYSKVEFINCNGKLNGNKLTLTDIPAFDSTVRAFCF